MSSAVSPSFSAIFGHNDSLLFIVIKLNSRRHHVHVPLRYHGGVDDYKWENSLGGIIIVVNCREVWFAAQLCAHCLVYFTSEHERLCLFAVQPPQYKQVSHLPANHTVVLLERCRPHWALCNKNSILNPFWFALTGQFPYPYIFFYLLITSHCHIVYNYTVYICT